MGTSKLKKFAQFARRSLIEQVSNKLKRVLAEGSLARRENPKAVAEIIKAVSNQASVISKSKETTDGCMLTAEGLLIEKVAYIWFNRFCALRFMDVNRYTRIGVVSPADGQFQPEVLAEAKMGHIDEGMVPDATKKQIFALLEGALPSNDPQAEAYRLLVVAACNFWHSSMSFMFERIADYTELLMPDDLLSENSILAHMRKAISLEAVSNQPSVISKSKETTDGCVLKAEGLKTDGLEVEVIGWLYQFYISEKKDEVFDGLKRNKKITPENIPAATQLFTPHWIVRYLVENSLGRLWMLNRPGSKLVEQMDYYIKPEQPETDFLRISKPEEIKICDPACGSGHMLTYAFDLLYAMYEEEGYEPAEIPEKILTHNLYGIEIDERAGELAAFALTMKAASYLKRAKQRRFFNKRVKPNICVLENVQFNEGELTEYMDFVGRDLFTAPLQTTLRQFEESDNFGSLIRPEVTDMQEMLRTLEVQDVSGQLFLSLTHQKVLQVLRQADYLSAKYHVVIANPPYMGGKGMNGKLGDFARANYSDSKADLFAMFMERALSLSLKFGAVAMINMQAWMFLSSFGKLRGKIHREATLLTMAHLGTRAFDSIGGEVVSTTAFVLQNASNPTRKGDYLRLVSGRSESEKSCIALDIASGRDKSAKFTSSSDEMMRIPGEPVAYWVKASVARSFNEKRLSDLAEICGGLSTSDNDRFVRRWSEVSIVRRKLDHHAGSPFAKNTQWYPLNKGGPMRRWYGNMEHLIRLCLR